MNSEFKPHLSARSLESEFREIVGRQHQQRAQKSWLRQIGKSLLSFLTGAQTVSIRERTHRGETQWVVYDPQQDVCKVFTSQQAVRIWLEQQKHL